MVLEEYHLSNFEAYLNDDFQVIDHPSGPFALKLVGASNQALTPRQEIFTLLFHGPGGSFLPQGTYRLNHAGLGEMALFLVPVGQDMSGYQYEAVFNRLISTGQ